MYNPINLPLEQFINCFFEADENVHIRIFEDKKTGAGGRPSVFKGAKLRCEAAKIGTLTDTLRKHNEQKAYPLTGLLYWANDI